MSKEKPPGDDKKSVIEFPSSRRKPVPPSESSNIVTPDSSPNVYDMHEERKRHEREMLSNLRKNLGSRPKIQDGEPIKKAFEHNADDLHLLHMSLVHEMTLIGLSPEIAEQLFDSALLLVHTTESDSIETSPNFSAMTEEEKDTYYEERWAKTREKYKDECPNARETWIDPHAPQFSKIPPLETLEIETPTLEDRFFTWFYDVAFMRPAKFFSRFFNKPTPPPES